MDQVITTGMAKEPDQRYATTKDLATAARAAVGADRIALRPRSRTARRRRRGRGRHRTEQLNQPGPTMAARPPEPTERLHRPDPAAFAAATQYRTPAVQGPPPPPARPSRRAVRTAQKHLLGAGRRIARRDVAVAAAIMFTR